jgi:hypothetical protein
MKLKKKRRARSGDMFVEEGRGKPWIASPTARAIDYEVRWRPGPANCRAQFGDR